jgi:epoxyqueuosine reductase
VDATRCISYLTIEHAEDNIPAAIQPDMKNWIFGCDICQDVCPWNKFKYATDEPAYQPREGVTDTDLRAWTELNLEAFEQRFAESPVERATFEGFQRNARMALETAIAQGSAEPSS